MGALARECRAVLEEAVPGDPKGRTYARAIADRLAEWALKGHTGCIRELADRAEGRAGQLLDIEVRPRSFDTDAQGPESSLNSSEKELVIDVKSKDDDA
jgi:hypothetical protein